SSTVDTVDRGSAEFQSQREVYTMQDIKDSIGGISIDPTYTPLPGQIPRWIDGTTIGGGNPPSIATGTGPSTVVNRSYATEFIYPKYTQFGLHAWSGWWKLGFPIGSMASVEAMGPTHAKDFIVWDTAVSDTVVDFTGGDPIRYLETIAIGVNYAKDTFTNSNTNHQACVFIGMGTGLKLYAGKSITDGVHIGANQFSGGLAEIDSSFSSNVIIGASAFEDATIEQQVQYNVFIGREQGMDSNPSVASNFNSYVGYRAMGGKVNGTENVAMGYTSGFDTSNSASSNYNSFYGAKAGFEHVSGDYNTFIGYNSGPSNNAASTGSNNTAIGNGAQFTSAATSNEIVLGNSSVTALKCQVQTITALSDERDKSNIVDLNHGLDLVMNLKPRKFVWDLREETVIETEEKITPGEDGKKDVTEFIETSKIVKPSTSGVKDVGFIAQELQELDNDFLRLVNSSDPDKLQASYGRLIPVLVKAIQDLKSEIDLLK
ncbi:MAG: tail fiber domain-containing protein, partial [Flavobacteriales bacterium]|nr:tail fiber domain-containing protein [Flavobacteriales bacterium]